MRPAFIGSTTSIELHGKVIPGADDRQRRIPGFDQEIFSRSHVLCIGAGGIISQIAPTLVRKGIGRITLLDDDVVEPSNLNRQRFYIKDVGENKALALARNLQPECIIATQIFGYGMRLEEAIAREVDLQCDVVICGVDNNPARVAASRFFRLKKIPAIFTAVSRDADHGFVFVQERSGSCIGCVFPDMANDDRYPCPATPAIADILQMMGAVAVYCIDTVLMKRRRMWNYRGSCLSDPTCDGWSMIVRRETCGLCGRPSTQQNSNNSRPRVVRNMTNVTYS